MMKKELAKTLRNIAQKLSPEYKLLFPEVKIDRYDIEKLGVRYPLTMHEVEHICLNELGMNIYTTPIHVMRRACIDHLKDKIKKGLFMAIDKNNLIKYEIDEDCIRGYLYLRKNEQD